MKLLCIFLCINNEPAIKSSVYIVNMMNFSYVSLLQSFIISVVRYAFTKHMRNLFMTFFPLLLSQKIIRRNNIYIPFILCVFLFLFLYGRCSFFLSSFHSFGSLRFGRHRQKRVTEVTLTVNSNSFNPEDTMLETNEKKNSELNLK